MDDTLEYYPSTKQVRPRARVLMRPIKVGNKVFEARYVAAEYFGISPGTISNRVNQKQRIQGHKVERYKTNYFEKMRYFNGEN